MSLLNYVDDIESDIATEFGFLFLFALKKGSEDRRQKNDLRSVTLLEASAKVKGIAISRERIILKDELQYGTFEHIFHGVLVDEKDPNMEKEWQPTPVFLPGKSHCQRSLGAYSPWHHKETDTT